MLAERLGVCGARGCLLSNMLAESGGNKSSGWGSGRPLGGIEWQLGKAGSVGLASCVGRTRSGPPESEERCAGVPRLLRKVLDCRLLCAT